MFKGFIAIITVVLSLLPIGTLAQPDCDLTPLTLPLFDATPLPTVAVDLSAMATPVVDGFDTDDAQAILEQYVSCTNTGDPTLVWAMFSPRWFSQQFADSTTHYLPAFEYQIATGHTEITNPLSLEGIEQIEVLPDGRVLVTATFASADQVWTDQLVLIQINGKWYIDDIVLPDNEN